jgi:drug/metabolite transporter (DMT)-like permease
VGAALYRECAVTIVAVHKDSSHPAAPEPDSGDAGLPAAVLAAGGSVTAASLGWGLAAGVASGAGVIVFFAGLAAAPVSVVAPLSALGAALLPVGVAVAEGARLGATVLAGAGLCLAAVALVSLEGRQSGSPAGRRAAAGVACGIGAGVAFGLYFLFIRNVASAGGLWPLVLSRCTASAIVLTAAAWRRRLPVLSGAGGRWSGRFALAVVVTALYPTVTVLLARLVLGERMRAVQRAGLALGAVGIILITA